MQVSFNAQPVLKPSLSLSAVGRRTNAGASPRFGSGVEVGLGLLPLLAGGLVALGSGVYLAVRKIREKRQKAQEEEMFRNLSQGGCCGFDSPERKALNSCCKLEDPDNNPSSD
jgi:hypothetical protein